MISLRLLHNEREVAAAIISIGSKYLVLRRVPIITALRLCVEDDALQLARPYLQPSGGKAHEQMKLSLSLSSLSLSPRYASLSGCEPARAAFAGRTQTFHL